MRRKIAAILGVVTLAAGCGDPAPPPAPTPAVPTITDTFSGTLAVQSTDRHPFIVKQVGGLEVTLTALDPAASVGIGIGLAVGATCTVTHSVTTGPGTAAQLTGTATIAGAFCVTIYDVGSLVEPVNYTISVLHS
jgi:hypothetical protein